VALPFTEAADELAMIGVLAPGASLDPDPAIG